MADTDNALDQAQAQIESIQAMVAANCDYDRLDELRDEYEELRLAAEKGAPGALSGKKRTAKSWKN